jgi:DNA-binding LytR/AlgR family response regulator
MTAARRIRERDNDVVIVFVTSAPQYAISGYEVDALSYLLKPVGYAAFEQELSRCLLRLRRRERRTLLFTDSEGVVHRIDVADVLYIETVRHRLMIRTLDGDYTVAGALKVMEAELAGDDFFRCNSGYLVNLRHVTGVEGNDCRIRGGVRLQISRPRKKEFLAALAAYIGARGITA